MINTYVQDIVSNRAVYIRTIHSMTHNQAQTEDMYQNLYIYLAEQEDAYFDKFQNIHDFRNYCHTIIHRWQLQKIKTIQRQSSKLKKHQKRSRRRYAPSVNKICLADVEPILHTMPDHIRIVLQHYLIYGSRTTTILHQRTNIPRRTLQRYKLKAIQFLRSHA